MNADDREKTCLPLFAEMPLLRALGQEAQRFIAGGCHLRTAAKGLVVCDKGADLDGVFFVVSGRVKLSVLSPDGAEHVVDILLPGSLFGESAALLSQPCPLHAETLSDARLLVVERERLRAAIARWPDVAFAVIGRIAQRVQDLTGDLEACCLHSATERVAGFLLRDACSTGCGPDAAEVVLPAAKVVVASRLNLTAETFSRELHNLAREGIVEIERRTVRVLSLRRLRQLCGTA
jgi:CRP-like cAMP-binding protein